MSSDMEYDSRDKRLGVNSWFVSVEWNDNKYFIVYQTISIERMFTN